MTHPSHMTPAVLARQLRFIALNIHPEHSEYLTQAAAYLIEFESMVDQVQKMFQLENEARKLKEIQDLEQTWRES